MSRDVEVVITGQLRGADELIGAIDAHLETWADRINLRWTLSTWLSEVDGQESLVAQLKDRDVRLVLAPEPPRWGGHSALVQCVALSNGLFAIGDNSIVVRTRTDFLKSRGIHPYLRIVEESPQRATERLWVQAVALNRLYFATDRSLTRFPGHLIWTMIRSGGVRYACTEAAGVPASCP